MSTKHGGGNTMLIERRRENKIVIERGRVTHEGDNRGFIAAIYLSLLHTSQPQIRSLAFNAS